MDGVQDRFIARPAKENYLCSMLWAGELQRAPRLAGPHEEFNTTMDYMVAKALGLLMGEISLEALVQKVDIPVVDFGVSAESPR